MTPEQIAAALAAAGLDGVRINRRHCPAAVLPSGRYAVFWPAGPVRAQRRDQPMPEPARLCLYAPAGGGKWDQHPVASLRGTAAALLARLAAGDIR